ncbi:hypothetical protein Cfor_03744 [Coptotermes formosanus]|uniref:Brix domain-containing protein n=1 Tax=Coptotermes formosanus TaxID=36987 RepID=A0A6L2PBA1_COPFO|nr:hypothetical protein Cfor_03744 [Coptotermes formosanus]
MGKRKKGRSVKNNIQADTEEPEELKRAPHSFVIHRGDVGGYVIELTRDFRKVMEPFTASCLKPRKKNTIKDFVSIAGLLHVSHLCIFTSTELGTYMKIARLPHGPTLTFQVHSYSLTRDVVSAMKKQFVFEKLYQNASLIVMNSFSGEGRHMKLMASMFQNMFPTINITKVKLSNIRRCVLLNYDVNTKMIDFRHYAVKAVPVGLSKGIKKLVQSKVPNLGRFEDISDFITKSGQLSESEAEDDPGSHVTLPQKLSSRGNIASAQSALRLIELGPRLTLQASPALDGVLNGEVLFHEFIEKTEEEKLLIKKKREEKRKLKEKRKRIQDENTRKKAQKKEEMKQKSLKGMQKKLENQSEMHKLQAEVEEDAGSGEDDNDAEWYRKEVGHDPETGLFDSVPRRQNKRKLSSSRGPFHKKKKESLKYGTNAEMNPTIQNKFLKGKQKFARDGAVQKNKFHKRKVFGSKISKKNKP